MTTRRRYVRVLAVHVIRRRTLTLNLILVILHVDVLLLHVIVQRLSFFFFRSRRRRRLVCLFLLKVQIKITVEGWLVLATVRSISYTVYPIPRTKTNKYRSSIDWLNWLNITNRMQKLALSALYTSVCIRLSGASGVQSIDQCQD